jgi:DNA-binding protein YbaB
MYFLGFAIALGVELRYVPYTMANISKLKIVQYKRRAISQRIAQQREILDVLEAQERDLEVAERVLAALDAEEAESEVVLEPEQEVAPVSAEPAGKPEGIPTMPDMIIEALKDAKARGQRGLEPKQMASFIAAKYWPTVTINAVGPIAWRMHTKERLGKRQSRYFLPKASSEETTDSNASA